MKPAPKPARAAIRLGLGLALLSLMLLVLGMWAGSLHWSSWRAFVAALSGQGDEVARTVLWQIRWPRSLAAWLAGGLLGLAGAMAQGLFRNPLADPYLLGSAAGANLGVAALLSLAGASPLAAGVALRLGMTGAAFAGALLAVLLTLALARGASQTLRLLLAGVIVGMVLAALASLLVLRQPHIQPTMQAFMLGSTAYAGWPGVQVLALAGVVAVLAGVLAARLLDALLLGADGARALGLPLRLGQWLLVTALALATGAAVAQIGLVAFVGLVAPHLVRLAVQPLHRVLLVLSALAGGVLLLAADLLARVVLAPEELPVGVVTALLGGGYMLWLMRRTRA